MFSRVLLLRRQQVLHNLAATVIQAYLGHRSIMSTVRYTAMTPNRFKNFWKD
jgi:site-specific recombinase XerD